MASDRYELLEMTKTETLLEQIIKQAQHYFLRMRTEYVLDTIAKEVKDPLISSHWNTLNSPTQSCVKITISTHGYDALCRTPLFIHVGEKTLKCICRDGKVMHMSYEPQELRDLIVCHMNLHQILGVQSLARTMGWQSLANSNHLGKYLIISSNSVYAQKHFLYTLVEVLAWELDNPKYISYNFQLCGFNFLFCSFEKHFFHCLSHFTH